MIVVLIDEHGERLMFPSRGASAMLESVDPAWLDDLEILHLTAYSFETGSTVAAVGEVVREHKRRGGRVSLDVSSVGMIDHFGVNNFLGLMVDLQPDFISANQDESLYLGLSDGDRPGPNLGSFDTVLRLARDATQAFSYGRHVTTVPVTPVDDVRDLTGAGDSPNRRFPLVVPHERRGCGRKLPLVTHWPGQVLRSPGATENADTVAD